VYEIKARPAAGSALVGPAGAPRAVPALTVPLIWLAHSLRTLVTPRGRLRVVPVAQRMLGQMRLFAAREFGGAAAGWAC
jgi:hypothetical protein